MALGSLPAARLKMGSAVFNTMRNLGGAIGIACINTWLNDRTNLHWARLVESLGMDGTGRVNNGLHEIAAQIGAPEGDPRIMAVLASRVRREAVTMAFADVFWMMAVLFLVMPALIPFLGRPASPAGAAAAVAKEAH